ncbi:MAG: hypothetical protein QOF70_7396 [Acetobacteraceae bacterium]|jgi:hypothetical protein|nr:hypothetical protein [Acetobacteraceae bacterium]
MMSSNAAAEWWSIAKLILLAGMGALWQRQWIALLPATGST